MSKPNAFCSAKVRVTNNAGLVNDWSFCDLPPGHQGSHSFHLHGARADDVVSSQLERLSKLEALLLEARSMLRANPKASKLVKQMNEVLP